jgi:hypothetical protein
MYWLFAMFGALALIDISLELTKIRKLMERRPAADGTPH